jgi:hypothetical protein
MTIMKSGQELRHVIEKAIADQVITMAEYEEIMSVASKDGVIDKQEKALLEQLRLLLENRTIWFGKAP